MFVRRKSIYLQTYGSFKSAKKLESANPKSIIYKFANSQITKNLVSANPESALYKFSNNQKLGPQIAKPQGDHICGRPANIKNYLSPKI